MLQRSKATAWNGRRARGRMSVTRFPKPARPPRKWLLEIAEQGLRAKPPAWERSGLHALDPGAEFDELFVDALVAAVDVVDAVDLGRSLGLESG